MDHHRHERVVSAVLEQRAGELSSTPGVTPEECLEQDEEYEWARQALAELCPSHQRIIGLREIEGWSADDMAAADGTTPEAATAALYRARQRLRDAYHRVAAGAMAGVAWLPSMRRRLELWAHLTGQAASSSPGFVSHAGDAVAAVVAIAVVSGAGVVNPLPQPSVPDRPAGVTAQSKTVPTGVVNAVNGESPSASAASPALAATSGTAEAASSSVATLIVPGTPDNITVNQFTVAPVTSSSRDVYASGTSTEGCPPSPSGPSHTAAPCAVLFHSADGGATWARLKASGFSGGTVLLTPTFPIDNRIFVTGPSGLQVSKDDGATFTTAVPLSGPTAVSPAFAFDHRILIGAVPGWEYRDDLNSTTPLHLTNRPPGQTLSFGFSSSYARDGELFVGSSIPSSTDPTQRSAIVTECIFGKCSTPAALPGAQVLPTVVASRNFDTNGVVFAWAGNLFYRSIDGGTSFKPVALPGNFGIEGIAEDADGALYVSLLSTDPKSTTSGGLYVTRDGGKTWTQLGKDSALGKGATSVSALGHDRLLASPASGGLLCSADAGKTWAKRCPTTP
ncbi:MAG: hypothetical protein JO086_14450, partial [Acidimicrobiia bacterium]|nr:hypothetical protein [Acidimicrobiia bacterium]